MGRVIVDHMKKVQFFLEIPFKKEMTDQARNNQNVKHVVQWYTCYLGPQTIAVSKIFVDNTNMIHEVNMDTIQHVLKETYSNFKNDILLKIK